MPPRQPPRLPYGRDLSAGREPSSFQGKQEQKKRQQKKLQALQIWLPDLDSNQDKLNQNQLCYHYTIGQKNECVLT